MDTIVALQEEAEFANRNKDRIRRRLQDRYTCLATSHIYCYSNRDGVHLTLSEDAIEIWVDCMHNCEATILNPPESVIPLLRKVRASDVVSIKSQASYHTPPSSANSSLSGNAIEYQRIFRMRGRHSLTDIRSLQTRLSTSSNSSGSSGVIGLGYFSGKAVKWVGKKLLQGVGQIEVRRRRWIIGQFVTNMSRIPVGDRSLYITKRGDKMNQVTEDLLELSMGTYKKTFRSTAIEQGAKLQGLIFESFVLREQGRTLLPIAVKLFPLLLLNAYPSACAGFASDLREILLQERYQEDDEEALLLDCVMQICYELAYGAPSPWRPEGYKALTRLYRTSIGLQVLQALGRRGNLIERLSRTAFECEIKDPTEHATAVQFFIPYADDAPEFQTILSNPPGIPLLVTRIKETTINGMTFSSVRPEVRRGLSTLGFVSNYTWCAQILLELDIQSMLANMLACNFSEPGTSEKLVELAWDDWNLVSLLRNIALLGGQKGELTIRALISAEVRPILHQCIMRIQCNLGDSSGQRTKAHVSDIEKILDMPQGEHLDEVIMEV